MAKKTRKEKIIAQYRRKLQLLETRSENIISPPVVANKQHIEAKQIMSSSVSLSDEDQVTKKYFISDFKKSLIIIVLVIALEIGLYFVTILMSKS